MAEVAKSDIDRAIDHGFSILTSEVFVPDQIVRLMRVARGALALHFPDRWEAVARRAILNRSYRVGNRDGKNYHLYADNQKIPVYSTTLASARRFTSASARELKQAVLRNGPLRDTRDAFAVDTAPSGALTFKRRGSR